MLKQRQRDIRLAPPAVLAVLALLAATGCGGGGGGGSGGASGSGSLNFNATWQHPDQTQAAISGQTGEVTRGSFGPGLPAAVKTIEIEFSSAVKHCCVAVNPSNVQIDPTGRGVLVLDALPAGAASVTIAGFPTDFAPAPPGATEICATVPASVGEPCSTQAALPSFKSDPQPVIIVGGSESDAGNIEVPALPFLVQTTPSAGGAAVNPVSVSFTVADAATGIDQQSVGAVVTQANGSPASLPLTFSSCDDATATQCSSAGQLGVKGFHVTGQAVNLAPGIAQFRIVARNLASPPGSLDFTYAFTVGAVVVSPSPTPSPTATPTPGAPTPTFGPPVLIVVQSGGNLAGVAHRLPPGSTLIASPGVYGPVDFGPGDLQDGITFLADVTGTLTNSPAAPVVINARGHSAAISLANQVDVTIDGFTLRGGTQAGLLVVTSSGVSARNCEVSLNHGSGVLFRDSDSGLVFNSLITENSGAGISMLGSSGMRVISNTVYHNLGSGFVVGDGTDPSGAISVENNIFDHNGPFGIVVDSSTTAYEGNFNLNNDGYQGTSPGEQDLVNQNPLFISPSSDDFRVQAFPGGTTSPVVDAGDSQLDPDLATVLVQRSARTDGMLDSPPFDLGYHYLPPPAPTPVH